MLDDRRLFDLEVADRTIYDEFAKVTYGGTGAYELLVSPAEITIRGQPRNALSDRLISAARRIATMLNTAHGGSTNFLVWQTTETVQATTESGAAAIEFCRMLVDIGDYERAVGRTALTAFPRIVFIDESTYFDIRIEPAFATGGKDLHVIVDARRQLAGDGLEAVLSTTEVVRQHMDMFRTTAHELFAAEMAKSP